MKVLVDDNLDHDFHAALTPFGDVFVRSFLSDPALSPHEFDADLLFVAGSHLTDALIDACHAHHIYLVAVDTPDHLQNLRHFDVDDFLLTTLPAELRHWRLQLIDAHIQQRQKERADEHEQQLVREVISQIPGMVYRFELHPDGQHRMTFISENTEFFFGHSADELEDITPFFQTIHPDDLDDVKASIQHSADTLSPWDCEFRVFSHDRYRWFHGQSLPHRRPDGSTVWHGFFRDIEPQKRLEDRLRIADRLATLGTLAAGITHEINNPLAVIVQNLSEALTADEHLDASQTRLLQTALRASQRINKIIQSLEGFAFMKPSPMLPLNLKKPLEDACKIIATDLQSRARFSIVYESDPQVLGRRNDLMQVFLSLLLNASQALPDRPDRQNHITVVLTTTTDPDTGGPLARVSIRDNGIGIPPDVLPQIFDPFFTTKNIGEGTGLGLYIAHTLMEAMHGRIDVDSSPDQTTFHVYLPLLDDLMEDSTSD